METMTTPTIIEPTQPALIEDQRNMGQNPPAMIENRSEMIKWEAKIKMIPKRELNLLNKLEQAYAIVWDQCSIAVRSKIEQLPNYNQINLKKEPMELLTKVRNIVCGREAHKQPLYSMS